MARGIGITKTIVMVETAEGPFSPKNNHISMPKDRGLAVTLKAERVHCCAQLLVENGVPTKYHNPVTPGRMPLV